jgi:cell division protein FtsB
MQGKVDQKRFSSRTTGSNPNVTSAVGMGPTSRQQKVRRSSLFARAVIWITALVCLAFLLATLAQAWSNSQLTQRVTEAQQQLQQVQQHNAALQKQAQHYKDPFVIESEARQQLGYIRPGEHPVVIVSSSGPAQPTPVQHHASPAPPSIWQQWWNIFFGN